MDVLLPWVVALAAVAAVPLTVHLLSKREAARLDAFLRHLKDAAPVGGLPPALWQEQHDLRKRELSLAEQRFEIEKPYRQKVFEAQVRKANARQHALVRDPEA